MTNHDETKLLLDPDSDEDPDIVAVTLKENRVDLEGITSPSASVNQNNIATDFSLQRNGIIGCFLVVFDVHAGNMIEVSLPQGLNLEGIEFKALTSGCHTVDEDFVFFTYNQLFCVCCYKKVESQDIERRARMKSIGVCATSYSHLHTFLPKLSSLLSHYVNTTSNDYTRIVKFFSEHEDTFDDPFASYSIFGESPRSLQITHPAGCFSQFINFFGPKIFVFWRLVLLRKRILFYSPPPVGISCYRVYCCSCLMNHTIRDIPNLTVNPIFAVGLIDSEQLSSLPYYIACTTDRIFEIKEHLFDVFIDRQMLNPSRQDRDSELDLTNLCKVTLSDNARFTHLQRLMNEATALCTTDDEKIHREQTAFIQSAADRFFVSQILETYHMECLIFDINRCCDVM